MTVINIKLFHCCKIHIKRVYDPLRLFKTKFIFWHCPMIDFAFSEKVKNDLNAKKSVDFSILMQR